MKKFITPTYTFSPGASGVGTVNLSGIASFDEKKLVSIINQTRGVVIYATGSAGLKYTNVSGTTVTLFFDTSSHNAADVLQVLYESDDAITVTGGATEAKQDTGNTSLGSIDGKLGSLGQKAMAGSAPVVIASDQSAIPASQSGTWNINNVSGTISLPTGAATAANQTTANSSLSSIDGKLPALSGGRVPVDIGGSGSITITSGTITVANEVEIKNDVGNPVPMSAASLPLPTGAATETTLAALNTKTPSLGQANNANSSPVVISSQQTSTVPAARGSQALITTPSPQNLFRSTFASAVPSGVDTSFFSVVQTGTGQTVAQTGGNLVLTTGTSANTETIIRSNSSFVGPMVARAQTILSQRIANNNFFVELVDVIGDGLAVTVNSATSITVTIPSNPFTSANVGQFMYVGAVQNISSAAVPGRYAIASVAGNNVTFTVAGWPASGSGTCSLFGWNYYQLVYTGTTATAVNYDAQRRGYASGVTAATINTTASPGHMAVMVNNDGNAYLADQLTASAAGTVQLAQRASRVVNLADENANLFLQIRTANGTVAPASTTTWTVGTVSVENYSATSVVINDVKPLGPGNQVPVAITNTPNIGTVTTVTGVTTVTTVSTVSAVTSANLGTSSLVGDVASAALTTTTTTAAISPTFGTAYEVNIPVTVVSGSSPTLDVGVEESDDSGTNWYRVYDFPRITATGMYRSPTLRLRGNRVRYVQTVGGSTPSFTRAINRLQQSVPGSLLGQFIDRTINPNTLNSTSPTYFVEGMTDIGVVVRCTAQTSAATIAVEFSDDNVNWIRFAKSITTVNGFSAPLAVSPRWKFLRLNVTSAGSGITLGEATIKSGETQSDSATETTLSALLTELQLKAKLTDTQPVSAASLPLPTGAATAANQTTANSSLSSIDGKLTTTVNGLKVDGSAVTQPISAASLPLPTGAATAANQTTANSSLSSIDGKLGSLGQKAMVGSAPVVIASDQTAIPASQSGTWNINNVSGTISLPTGAATAANQTTTNSSLSSIDGKIPSLGQALMAASTPVTIASNQSAIPVSAASLPLPTGAATESTLSTLNGKIPSNLTVTATRLLVDGSGVTQPVSGSVSVSNFPATQNVAVTSALPAGNNNIGDVDVASLPVSFNSGNSDATTQRVVIATNQSAIPVTGTLSATITGVSTEAKQDVGNTSLASIDSKLPALSGGRVPVDIGGSGSITITSGTVTVSNEVEIKNDVGNPVPISAASLPLPTGAATESTLSALNTKVPANLTVTATRLLVDGSGVTQPVSAASLPLPTGAATESTLSTLSGKFGSLGQKTMVGSAPVVIASDQSAIPASQSGTWNITNISGTVSLPTGAATAANQTTQITHLSNIAGATLVDNAEFTDGTTRLSIAGYIYDDVAGTALTENDAAAARIDAKRAVVHVFEDGVTRGRYATVTAANAVKVDGSAVTQPISAASLPLPTGAATETTLSAVSTKLPATLGQKTSANSLAVSIASDQSAIPASQSGTWNITNISGTVSLPTGAATSANQTTGNTSLSNIDTKTPSLGQALMAASTPVVIASNQSAVPISAASLPLPTGAATETTLSALNTKVPANLTVTATRLLVDNSGVTQPISAASLPLPTGAASETTLSAINGKLGSLGQKTMVGSAPVVIASDQSAIPASQSGTWNINNVSGTISLPTGAATSANQATANTSLSNIDTQVTALNAKDFATSAKQDTSNTSLASIDGKLPALSGGRVPVDIGGSGSITITSGTITVANEVEIKNDVGNPVPMSAASLPLPTGAATETTLSTLNGKIPNLGQALMANSIPVALASNQSAIPVTQGGKTAVDRARLSYSVTNVTTSAYVQLDASLAGTCSEIEIFDSSGETLILATGAAGFEVDQIFVFPGGNGRVPLAINSGTRISIKAVSATANSGEIAINFYS